MSEEGPKLYSNKPKKSQIKQFQDHHPKVKEVSSPSSSSSSSSAPASASSTMGSQSSSPPPQPPKESFARRYKFLWPMLLTVNLAVGAYLFMRTKKKETEVEEKVAEEIVATTNLTQPASNAPVIEQSLATPAVVDIKPVAVREPIPEDKQRELFKWILEEKRKIKTKDPEEKKRIDEEKAILKEFIRTKSIPRI